MPSSTVVSALPGFVPGTFDGQMVRLATLGNSLPGLFASGDFAVTQRAAGANQSVDIASGRCFVDPQATSQQGVYLARTAQSYNTLADLGLTWTASDPTNPRIDLVCVEVADTDFSGSYTGFKFRVVDGTPNASAAHQLDAQYWPTIPTGLVPIAAVRRAATATTIATADITNLNPIGGQGRSDARYTTAAETTTSATYARLATPDALMVYVPSTGARVRVGFQAHWKISVASGNQFVSFFIDGAQIKAPMAGAAPAVLDAYASTISGTANTYRRLATNGGAVGFSVDASGVSDVSDVTTGLVFGNAGTANGGPMEIAGLSAGWHLIEVRYKTSANTLTVRERRMQAEIVG